MIEEDGVATVTHCQSSAEYFLKRINAQSLPIDYAQEPPYSYVDPEVVPIVYVVDTLILESHIDFHGRVENVFSNQPFTGKYNGHGTHVAGLITSEHFGVVKQSKVKGVAVLNEQGFGTWSKIIEGLSFISKDVAENHPNQTVVVNMSIGGKINRAVNAAVDALVKQGIVVVVSAGNNNQDSCQFSPASASLAISVGATDSKDNYATFSNHGKCVHLSAPGVRILSTYPTSNGRGTAYLSGTSMSAPLVSGVAALFLSKICTKNFSPKVVKRHLLNTALCNKLKNVPENTKNTLLHQGERDDNCLAGAVDLSNKNSINYNQDLYEQYKFIKNIDEFLL
jgi:subtilisin family serine protease